MKQELENQSIITLKVGNTYKIFEISDFMAHTIARYIKIDTFDTEKGKYVFHQGRERKKYYMRISESTIILPGDTLLKADSEGKSFAGNACLNLVGSPEEIRDIIDKENLNPTLNKGLIVSVRQTTEHRPSGFVVTKNEDEKIVYPAEAEATKNQHAVIADMLRKEKKEVRA